MKAPDKIFVAEAMETEKGLFGLWTDKDHRDTPYVEFIRKEAILEWANKELKRYSEDTQWEFGYSRALRDLIDKLNQL